MISKETREKVEVYLVNGMAHDLLDSNGVDGVLGELSYFLRFGCIGYKNYQDPEFWETLDENMRGCACDLRGVPGLTNEEWEQIVSEIKFTATCEHCERKTS